MIPNLCLLPRLAALAAGLWIAAVGYAQAPRSLDIYFIDSEGGGSTLVVTPAGESILFDTGNPGGRDSARIHAVATKAGLSRIDHVIISHFHGDHFGGAAEVAQLMPLGTVYDKGVPAGDPDGRVGSPFLVRIRPYLEMPVEHRRTLEPGMVIPLRGTGRPGEPALELLCVGANQSFIEAPASRRQPNPRLVPVDAKPEDTSDNANSTVFVLQYGDFRFFHGGDLTWNVEEKLVAPYNIPGEVDVFQVQHHGLAQSNHPNLLRSLAPTISVMNNGPRKGGAPAVFAALNSLPSLEAMYQVHRNISVGPEGNAPADHMANHEAECEGHPLKLSVAADGATYTMSVPSTGHSRTFKTRVKAR